MNELRLTSAVLDSPELASPPRNDPAKVRDAAEQFESLLIGQILRSVRQSGGGWLGASDPSADCATDFAEQHFATMLARQGGLGLATLITRGLENRS